MTTPWHRHGWRARTKREQLAMQCGLGVLLCVLVWQLLMGPAWHTWLHSEKKHAQLDKQMAQMQAMQQQWQALPQQNGLAFESSLHALQQLVAALGEEAESRQTQAQFHVDVNDLSSQALAQFLVSSQAHARVREAHWEVVNSTPVNPPAENGQTTNRRWRGQLVFDLPPQSD